jgi:ribose-phosphate pyrophosphokinase
MKNHIHVNWETKTTPYQINLDEEFTPTISDTKVLDYKYFEFKGGEPHLQITTIVEYPGDLIITQRYNNIADLFQIILANDAARRMGFKNIHLILPYFPAARQDRVCNMGEPLTCKVFTDMINGCGFASVEIFCPHSEVVPALLNNVVVKDELEYVEKVIEDCLKPMQGYINIAKKDAIVKRFNIVQPDAGAGKRVGKIIQHLSNKFTNCEFKLIRCEKVRDVKDGSLKDFFVQADDLGRLDTLIVDDINCMGGTFIGLAKKLREKNCGKLMLFTAHADCVEGVQKIVENFDYYYTTNSKKNWGKFCYTFTDRFTCLPLY